jgi:predicted ATPase
LINEGPEAALGNLKHGREQLRKNRSVIHMPVYASIAGEILVQQGQFSEAIASLEGGLSDAKRTGAVWFNAELTRLMGEADLLQHPDDHTVACERFTSAMRIARDQGSKMFELRSAVSLANATTEKATLTGAVKRIQTLISEIDADDTAWDIQRAKAWLAAV